MMMPMMKRIYNYFFVEKYNLAVLFIGIVIGECIMAVTILHAIS
jgi:hypothetical protein